jgi:hypothetical protein
MQIDPTIKEQLMKQYGELPERLLIPRQIWPDHWRLLSTVEVLELIASHTQGRGTRNRQTIHKWKKRGWINEIRRGRPPGNRARATGNNTSYYYRGEILEVLFRLENNMMTDKF